MKTFPKLLAACFAAIILVAPCAGAWVQRNAPDGAKVLVLEKGRSTVVEADLKFATLVVADPEIADAMATSTDRGRSRTRPG